jgi:hypothetical protein
MFMKKAGFPLRLTANPAPYEEQEYRSKQGQQEAARLKTPPGRTPDQASDEAAEKRAGDSEEYRHDTPHRIPARHKEAGERADDESSDYPPDEMHHRGMFLSANN